MVNFALTPLCEFQKYRTLQSLNAKTAFSILTRNVGKMWEGLAIEHWYALQSVEMVVKRKMGSASDLLAAPKRWVRLSHGET